MSYPEEIQGKTSLQEMDLGLELQSLGRWHQTRHPKYVMPQKLFLYPKEA